MRNKILNGNQNIKRRYKMYRAGKQWLVAGILFIGSATALLTGGHLVRADTTSGNPVQTTQTADRQGAASAAGAASSSQQAPKAAETTSSAASTQQGQPASGTAPTQAAKQPDQPGASATGQPTARPSGGTAAQTDTVTPANFQQAFETHGNAHFDTNQPGTVVLTDYAGSQQGSVTLKNKINLGQGFDMKGQINLGAVDQDTRNGGDGIAFGFHDANSDQVGDGGDGLGLGGIPDAIGWKADTTYNWTATNDATADPAGFSNGPRRPNTSDWGGGQDFGAFIRSDKTTGLVSTTGKTAGEDSAQVIDAPAPGPTDKPNDDPKNWVGSFKDIEIKYTPNDQGKKLLTVYYDNKVWQEDITDWATGKTDTAFFVSAGTGANQNLQQFRLQSFTYQPAASVDVKYYYTTDQTLLKNPTAPVDPKTVEEIPNYVGTVDYPTGTFVGDSYLTNPEFIKGYTYVRLYTGSLPANGTLQEAGNNGTVKYLYVQNGNPGQIVNVKFWDKTTNKQLGQTVTFDGKAGSKSDYSDKATVDAYLKAGYAYNPQDDDTLTGITFDNDNGVDQTYNVYLSHQHKTVLATQTITRIIKYVKASDGSQIHQPSKTTFNLYRLGTQDLVTGTTTYSDWSTAEFSPVTSPTIQGYVPDVAQEPALAVNLQKNGMPTVKQLDLIVKYSQPVGQLPTTDPHVWFKAEVPPAIHEPTGKVPTTDPHVWFKAEVPPAVHEPTGKVPTTDPHVWFKAEVPPAVHEPTGKVPTTDPHVWFKAEVPPAVHKPTGKVPTTDPHVWFKAEVPPAVHEPTGKVPTSDPHAWFKAEVPPAIHEPTGKVPTSDPHVWFKAEVPPATHEPTGKVPTTDPHVWFKAEVPPAVHEPTGKVPTTDPHVWFKAEVPPAVHEPTGKVPTTDPHVWFKTEVPPAVHEPTGKVPTTDPHVWFKVAVPPAVSGRVETPVSNPETPSYLANPEPSQDGSFGDENKGTTPTGKIAGTKLPATGNKEDSVLTAIGVGVMALAGLFSRFILRKHEAD